MQGRLVGIKGELPDGLTAALDAIPGAPVELRGMAWTRRLGPDRAESLAQILAAYELELSESAEAGLLELRAARDVDNPVVEVVRDADGAWLSVLEDWQSFALEELRGIPGTRERAAAGRVEVPLTAWTADAIETAVRTHDLRLSPAAQSAMADLLGSETPEDPQAEPSSMSVVMDGHGHLVLKAPPHSELARQFTALAGARAWGDGSRWLVPTSPETARTLRRLADEDPYLTFDKQSLRWLTEAPRWIARIEVERTPRGPEIRMTTRWGDTPAALTDLDGLESRLTDLAAPLTAANVKRLAEIATPEPELTLSPAIANSIEWLTDNPTATEIPPAELDLVAEHGGSRLRVDAIWDEDPENAFLHQEDALLRQHRLINPRSDYFPATAWPPDRLTRFVRLHRIHVAPAAAHLVEGATQDDVDTERLIALSSAHDADITVEGLGGELMPFQRAGVAYALERRRVFLADEQGLGKTIQALATVQADDAYPAVVICPASLKLNWLRETKHWLPERTAKSIAGRGAQGLEGADLVVLNYEIVGAHVDELRRLAPQSLILDEAHYVKNPKAARTRAVLDLADALGPDALRLALTGTPVVNRPGRARVAAEGARPDRRVRRALDLQERLHHPALAPAAPPSAA